MVYIVYDGRQIVACRSGNNNLLCACIDVSLSLLLRSIETGALQNYIYIQLAPRTIVCIGLFVNGDGLTLYSDGTLLIISGNLILLTDSDVSSLGRIIL